MMRTVTWRFWAALGAALAAYGALGYWLSGNGTAEEWLYRVGLTAASVLPVAFVAVYGVLARWWRDDLGTVIALAALSIVPTCAPLAWAFWFQGGQLTATWLAWLAVSGPALSALVFTWAIRVWLRSRHAKPQG